MCWRWRGGGRRRWRPVPRPVEAEQVATGGLAAVARRRFPHRQPHHHRTPPATRAGRHGLPWRDLFSPAAAASPTCSASPNCCCSRVASLSLPPAVPLPSPSAGLPSLPLPRSTTAPRRRPARRHLLPPAVPCAAPPPLSPSARRQLPSLPQSACRAATPQPVSPPARRRGQGRGFSPLPPLPRLDLCCCFRRSLLSCSAQPNHAMKIAVEGCMHGELDKVYVTMRKLEESEGVKIDLLICCGDFQGLIVLWMVRSLTDDIPR